MSPKDEGQTLSTKNTRHWSHKDANMYEAQAPGAPGQVLFVKIL